MEIHSLSTLHVGKKPDEVHSQTKHFRSFTIKQNIREFYLNNWSRWGLVLKCKKTIEKYP